ncbi:MAG: transketolase family protein [Enterocloster sp.]|uniref:transketolase family protein n=1 Tax=Enterocloster sp. TaxID=2719315 RepID=UPI00399C1B9F
MTSRALDPIQSLIAYDGLNVRLCGTYCGLSDSYDGASHQAITDLAAMRSIPGMTVISVSDAVETKKAVMALADYKGPAYLRLSRAPHPVVYGDDMEFEIGKGIIHRDGSDITIISTGTMLHRVLEAADLLEQQGICATVVDMHTVEPIDAELIERMCRKDRGHTHRGRTFDPGGLGSAVAEAACCVLLQRPCQSWEPRHLQSPVTLTSSWKSMGMVPGI